MGADKRWGGQSFGRRSHRQSQRCRGRFAKTVTESACCYLYKVQGGSGFLPSTFRRMRVQSFYWLSIRYCAGVQPRLLFVEGVVSLMVTERCRAVFVTLIVSVLFRGCGEHGKEVRVEM